MFAVVAAASLGLLRVRSRGLAETVGAGGGVRPLPLRQDRGHHLWRCKEEDLATRTEHRAYQPSRFCSLGCGVLVSREVVFS